MGCNDWYFNLSTKCVTTIAKCVTTVAKCVTTVAKCVTSVAKCVTIVVKCVSTTCMYASCSSGVVRHKPAVIFLAITSATYFWSIINVVLIFPVPPVILTC